MAEDLITTTTDGLHCAAGDFHVDPWRPVPLAVVTHAHADHTRPGSAAYLTTPEGLPLVRRRVQPGARIEVLPYGQRLRMGDVTVSLHPAGHVLGSAQVRVERSGPRSNGEVWVVAGDYKTCPDPTCAPFEPVRADVLVSESTFGLPVYTWEPAARIAEAILAWWRANQAQGLTSVVFAYALGKSQRIMAELALAGELPGPIALHGAVARLVEGYREAGVSLPPAEHAIAERTDELRGRALLLAPPSAQGTPWMQRFGTTATALASGWMRLRGTRRRRNVDRGFVLSDHADWRGLLSAIEATGAQRVLVTHGYVDPLVRYLREERGLDAAPLATPFEGDGAEEEPEEPR